MKAVMPQVPPHILEWRKRTGTDQWDEMWEGVLHMPPAPNREHQDLQLTLAAWLLDAWARPHGNRVHTQVNLAPADGWPDDYRIPDLLLLTPARFSIDCNEYFEGAPDVVVEIRSPGDETMEKLPFYARLGVPEVWVIDRDTRVPVIYTLVDDAYQDLPPDADGWLRSRATGVRLRGEAGQKLALQLGDDAKTRELLPE